MPFTEFSGSCGPIGFSVSGRETFDCTFNNELVSVMCSFDGGAVENCSLPLVVDFSRFGTDNHTVVLTGTDVFGQTASVSLSFRVSVLCKDIEVEYKPVLTVVISPALFSKCGMSAVPGRQTFWCKFSNPLESVTCSFDGGPGETCSFPLEVGIGRFGTDNHTLDATVVDVFGQSEVVSFNFALIERKIFSSKYLSYHQLYIIHCTYSTR